MRSAAQRIVVHRPLPCPDPVDLTADRDHRVDERVEFGDVLALGGLDHEGAGHREAHRRRVEAVVGQTLRDVVDRHPRRLRQRTQIEDALVGDHAGLPRVQHREVLVETTRDVVGRRDRRQRRATQPLGTHHLDVRPGDRQDRRRSVGRRRDRSRSPESRLRRMARQVRGQMRTDADRADTRTAATVRDAERLVQVQVAHIAPELARPRQTHESVEVGTVDVHLTAGVVHGTADVGDVVLVHTVRGRIGDHDRGQARTVVGDLGAQVVEIDIPVRAARDDLDTHARHHGGCGIGAVRARRDQADVPIGVAAIEVVVTDREQTRVLALAAGVGLQAHGVVSRHRGEPAFEVGDEAADPRRLIRRSEGVQTRELGPGDGFHLGGGVELHRARAQRDHRPVEGEVLVGQAPQVTHHRGLGAVAGERRMLQELAGAGKGLRQRRSLGGVPGGDAEGAQDRVDVRRGGGLVARDRHVIVVDPVQVDAGLEGGGEHGVDTPRDAHEDGVEELIVDNLDATGAQTVGEAAGVPGDAAGDAGEAFGAVVRGVHGREHGEEHLGGADVAGGLLTADVLLTGLQREAVGRVAVRVHRDTDEASGQGAGVGATDGEVAGVRPAEAHRHTEPLGGAEARVGTLLPGRGDQGHGQQVGADSDERAAAVGRRDDRSGVDDAARSAGHLEDHAEELALGKSVGSEVDGDDLDTERFGAGRQHRGGLREQVDVDDQARALGLAVCAAQQGHGLGSGGGLVEHRRVRDLHAGQVGDHGLEVQQRLEASLADLRLVGGVGRVPGGVLDDVAQQHGRRERVVVAVADHRRRHGVLRRECLQFGEYVVLGAGRVEDVEAGRHVVCTVVEDGGRHRGGGEGVEGIDSHDVEDPVQAGGVGADVAIGEVRGDGICHRSSRAGRRGPHARGRARWFLPLCRELAERAPERFGRPEPFPVGGRVLPPLSRDVGAHAVPVA
ncbi:putative metal-dependent RNase [Rhodococcus pyridinivorans AK37]|uniref:Putative metal-dependent RNase n=1 Tax=Rhodococcus pyridinivorans AK37 TaxID=1114960 RepID=H0JSZ0_9NOCA|nr:putative metal-dependent RNase [Rhodococcus pyridinivorans AK37]